MSEMRCNRAILRGIGVLSIQRLWMTMSTTWRKCEFVSDVERTYLFSGLRPLDCKFHGSCNLDTFTAHASKDGPEATVGKSAKHSIKFVLLLQLLCRVGRIDGCVTLHLSYFTFTAEQQLTYLIVELLDRSRWKAISGILVVSKDVVFWQLRKSVSSVVLWMYLPDRRRGRRTGGYQFPVASAST